MTRHITDSREGECLQCSTSTIQHTTQQQQNAVQMVPNQTNTPRGAQKQQQTAVEMEEKSGKSN